MQEPNYIFTKSTAVTVKELIEVLAKEDPDASVYIMDDSGSIRTVQDIGRTDGRIMIYDF